IATPAWVATGSMVGNRNGAAHAQLADGRVLLVSGEDATAEIFDPAGSGGTGTYAATTFPPARTRSGGAAVRLADDRVIVAGGWNATDSYMLNTEIFDDSTGGFSAGASLNS